MLINTDKPTNTLTSLINLATNLKNVGEDRAAEAIRRAIAALEFYALVENYTPDGRVVCKTQPEVDTKGFRFGELDYGVVARDVLRG
jgi:hypothetical protein